MSIPETTICPSSRVEAIVRKREGREKKKMETQTRRKSKRNPGNVTREEPSGVRRFRRKQLAAVRFFVEVILGLERLWLGMGKGGGGWDRWSPRKLGNGDGAESAWPVGCQGGSGRKTGSWPLGIGRPGTRRVEYETTLSCGTGTREGLGGRVAWGRRARGRCRDWPQQSASSERLNLEVPVRVTAASVK